MRGRWWSAPAYLVLAGLISVLVFLIIPLNTDGSYTCRGSALVELVNPEPHESAAFRANFFDSGWVCNHRAQRRGEVAAVALGAFALAGTTWALIRRRSRVA